MGMFDLIECEYPLPYPLDGDRQFMTKDTPNQACDFYTIDDAGNLLVFDSGVMRKVPFSGKLDFYNFYTMGQGWVEFRAVFSDDKVVAIYALEITSVTHARERMTGANKMGIIEIIMLIVGIAAGVFGGQVIGKRQGRKQERVTRRMKDAETTNQAMKDVNHADANKPADVDDARKRLSDWHSKQ